MTEKQQSEKKPVWEPIDEKEVEEGKRSYLQEIGGEKVHLEKYKLKENDPAIKRQTPSMEAHLAALCLIQYHHIQMLETTYNLAEAFVEINRQLAVALQSLDKQIQEISEKTGVDLSQIKSEMAQVKETVNAPIYKYLKEQKDAEDKMRKSGEATFDHLTRSH